MKKARKYMNFFNRRKINLDISATCTLECPGCERKYYHGKVPGENLSLNNFKKLLNHFDSFEFCGQVSDPIFNPNLPLFLKLLYDNKKYTKVNVAASHKKKEWFIETFKHNVDATWTFGIDGLPEDSHKYRKNQDGKKLFDIMCLATNIVKKVNWQFIIFKYKEHQIQRAKYLANMVGVNLELVKSSRFSTEDMKEYKPTVDYIEPKSGRRFLGSTFELDEQIKVKPKCFDNKLVGFSSKGFVLPCCWCDTAEVEDDVKHLYNENLNINNNEIDDIMLSDEWLNFKNKIENDPPKVCQFYCGIDQETKKREIC